MTSCSLEVIIILMVERSKYLSVIFTLLPFIAQAKFVHPGLLNSKEELVFMKENRGWPLHCWQYGPTGWYTTLSAGSKEKRVASVHKRIEWDDRHG